MFTCRTAEIRQPKFSFRETLFIQIGQSETEAKEDEDDEETNDDDQPMQIKTYQEALRALEDEQQFLLSQGHMKEAMDIGCSVDSVQYTAKKSSHYSTVVRSHCSRTTVLLATLLLRRSNAVLRWKP